MNQIMCMYLDPACNHIEILKKFPAITNVNAQITRRLRQTSTGKRYEARLNGDYESSGAADSHTQSGIKPLEGERGDLI